MVLARMGAAMKRSRSGLIIRSWVETRNHDGSVFHAGGPAGSAKHVGCDRLLRRSQDLCLLKSRVPELPKAGS
jgi:hypothetical protein